MEATATTDQLTMDPVQHLLHALWWSPGAHMAAGWWNKLGLGRWRQAYQENATLRPALDQLIASRLGNNGPVPAMSNEARAVLGPQRQSWCLLLGLCALQCPDYLLFRHYQQALAPHVDGEQLRQMRVLFPMAPSTSAATLAPEELASEAQNSGAHSLSCAEDHAVAVSRLLWDPPTDLAPSTAVVPLLDKLLRWL